MALMSIAFYHNVALASRSRSEGTTALHAHSYALETTVIFTLYGEVLFDQRLHYLPLSVGQWNDLDWKLSHRRLLEYMMPITARK